MQNKTFATLLISISLMSGWLLGHSQGQPATPLPAAATPLGSAFTYQGRLTDSGSPPTAQYDLQFTLFDQSSGGIQIAGPITLDNVQVTNGLFTVQLDFGAGAFNGDNRFLAIGVRPGASTGAFTLLTTRQQLTATPYALYAQTAAVATSIRPA